MRPQRGWHHFPERPYIFSENFKGHPQRAGLALGFSLAIILANFTVSVARIQLARTIAQQLLSMPSTAIREGFRKT